MDEHRFKLFTRHVALPDANGCMLWTASTRSDGYGDFWVKVDSAWKHMGAHRVAYEHFVGPIPGGLQLDHLCRNKICVNPIHLEPVTNRENVLRGTGPVALNAAKTHCKYGHPFDGVNTRKYGTGRHCLTCDKRRNDERRAKIIRRYIANGAKTHCKHGHEFTLENTYLVGRWRRCRACFRANAKQYYWKQKHQQYSTKQQ